MVLLWQCPKGTLGRCRQLLMEGEDFVQKLDKVKLSCLVWTMEIHGVSFFLSKNLSIDKWQKP